jgi:hypothetical protein
MEPEGDSSTRMSIRAGLLGEEAETRARTIHSKIRELLG